jgi:hypothetical protein
MPDDQAPKVKRFRFIAEYADGSVTHMEVVKPVGVVAFRDETRDDAMPIEFAGPPTNLVWNSFLLRRYAIAFTANDATDIVVHTDEPTQNEEPGNGN